MERILNLLALSIKCPITYYIWGALALLYGMLINPIFHITSGSNTFFIIQGLLVLLNGIVISLSKSRTGPVQNIELENKINNIKNRSLRNIIRNICNFYNIYRSKDTYLCHFHRKTGSILLSFVKTEKEAKEYIEWYLSDNNDDYKNIILTENRVTKIFRNDIEEFKYKKVSALQQFIIDPAFAFLKQPVKAFVTLRKMLILTLLIYISVGMYYFVHPQYIFTGPQSLDTAKIILKASTYYLRGIVFIFTIGYLAIGVTSIKDIMANYYTNRQKGFKTLGGQLLVLSIFPYFYNVFLIPLAGKIVEYGQINGYFLP